MQSYLLSAEMMKAVDQYAIHTMGIPSLTLMERAGQCVAEEIEARLSPNCKSIWVLCGKGNNGGDGFVVARLLAQKGHPVRVILAAPAESFSGDAKANYARLPASVEIVHYTEERELLLIENAGECAKWENQSYSFCLKPEDLVVDALLGTGIHKPLRPPYDEMIAILNNTHCQVCAIDLPSGVNGTTGAILGNAVQADFTVTFACEKYAHRLFPAKDYCGTVILRDIGIPSQAVESVNSRVSLITPERVHQLLETRHPNSHKGDYGRILLVGGSKSMSGAISMAAQACLRTGGGLVTAAVPQCVHAIVAGRCMEHMTLSLPCDGNIFTEEAIPIICDFAQTCSTVALGCGMGNTPAATKLIEQLLQLPLQALVLDADGINALVPIIHLLKGAKCPVILTPHSGEMARLCGMSVEQVEQNRFRIAQHFAQQHDVTLVLKGHYTVVAQWGESLSVNTTGNSGMATGGSGDVLTGVIAALSAFRTFRHFSSAAAIAGVWLHGKAGDLAAHALSQHGMIAGDIIRYLPFALKEFDQWGDD